MKIPKAILAYMLAVVLGKYDPIKQAVKRITFGALFIAFSILSVSLTFVFAAITFFMYFTDQAIYTTAGLWTTGTLTIISILLFVSGIRFITKK
ncbi:hypothetical protein CO058_04205 [candidate division WWE3 bacterium CG_4_9_14_0_2_um_filter_35_11]|uniref:Uncharacterized protein n=2 Tax=Bacteria candidate phyla TaxID=1783234 RepID=A0A2M6P1B0_9BACT|nr:MAG: hypothetical protein COU30_02245 [Candidatus Magasanikbacteria bacterium CG10_big_fil_rev_8_21_14_0_10_38_6]PJC23280.1 MAG: hypothetical protein CO058_04205 [candidate division WWE3 bacterium CG_4_9_14_0_2_um_filter_35_11]